MPFRPHIPAKVVGVSNLKDESTRELPIPATRDVLVVEVCAHKRYSVGAEPPVAIFALTVSV